MPPIIWIDGTYYDRASAKVSVFDHGLLYGDGVFEGIRVYARRVFRLAQHLSRLYASAKGVWIEIPMPQPALHRLVEEAVAKSGLDDVIELAREATYAVEEIPLNRYDLYTADEMFFTGTAAEVVAVTKLDGRVIGSGKPGPVTKELSKRFRALATRGD